MAYTDKYTIIKPMAIVFVIVTICLIIFYSYFNLSTVSLSYVVHQPLKSTDDCQSIDKDFDAYFLNRSKTFKRLQKPLRISNDGQINYTLNDDYIEFIKNNQAKSYPYSTWKCTNTSNVEQITPDEYCILTNIYYQSSTDQYYFFRDPSQPVRDTFTASYGPFQLQVTDDIAVIKNLSYSSKLIRPLLITHPPDGNYAHGFLETCGPRFWALAECQSHPSYIDITKIQIYFTSAMFNPYPDNWNNYRRQSDGTYVQIRKWEYQIHPMFSIYPLLTHKSFNDTTVLFQHLIFTGLFRGRRPIWAHHYSDRPVVFYPFPTVNYQRAYLAFSEWILHNFNLKSKFHSNDEFNGEWIVVLNRAGRGTREMVNPDELVQALLQAFPNQSDPHLRVWPKQFNFNDNLYETARMARSIRLIIGVHGAGLSNTLFMRPGSILYEINPHGCRHLSFNFRRWAEIFYLQHALWIPTKGENGKRDEFCNREGRAILNVKEIVDEVKNLLANEIEYREGYLKRALHVINDVSIADHPPSDYENIL